MPSHWRASIAVAVLGSAAAAQATLLVPSQYATIQAAIAAAQTGDTVLVGPGTWFEHLDTLGKTLTLRGDQGAAATIIDGGGTGRPLVITGGAPVIDGLTLTHGTAPVVMVGQSAQQYGGAANITGGAPVFRDCNISQNTLTGDVGVGGGVCAVYCSPSFERCILSDNQISASTKRGAAVYLWGTTGASFRQCSFLNNSNQGGTQLPYSGAVETHSDTLFDSCVFRNNRAISGYGGAVRVTSAAVFRACLFDSNVASTGGAVLVTIPGEVSVPVHAVFDDCTFVANGSGPGAGGVCGAGYLTDLQFRSCEFLGNHATGNPAYTASAFYNISATASFASCVFAGNSGSPTIVHSSGSTTIRNCTIAGNTGGHAVAWMDTPVTNSVFWQNPGGDIGFSVPTTNCLFGTDPLFANAAAGDYHLLPGSPAIDAGTAVPVATDFEGDPSRFGAAVDIGADEYRIGAQLVLDQPSGPGSARIRVLAAPSGFGAFTPLSFYPQAAGTGADTRWAGLWVRFSELLDQAFLGVPPFVMPLDASGTATWQVPAGSLPPTLAGVAVHAVTTTFDPTIPDWGPASPVAHLVLQ